MVGLALIRVQLHHLVEHHGGITAARQREGQDEIRPRLLHGHAFEPDPVRATSALRLPAPTPPRGCAREGPSHTNIPRVPPSGSPSPRGPRNSAPALPRPASARLN